jgi:preprotein translocase subunit YajC
LLLLERKQLDGPFFFVQNHQHAMPKMHPLIDAFIILAQASAPAAPGSAPAIMTFLPIIFIFAAMYFLMIAPQRKKQKAQEKMLAALKTGDDVLTSGGIFGTITNVKDDRFVVRIAENVKVEVPKGFINSVITKSAGEEKK